MATEIITPGTGCAWFKRKNTSYIVDRNLLIDVPQGAYKDIIEFVEPKEIETIIITHLHEDHYLDLLLFLKAYYRDFNGDPKRLKIYCPSKTKELIKVLAEIVSTDNRFKQDEFLDSFIDFIDLKNDYEFTVNGSKFHTYAMEHGIETYGFTMTAPDETVIGFSADTAECENLHKILGKSNFAFVDMSAKANSNPKTHIDETTFERLENEYPFCTMIPVHMSDITYKNAREKYPYLMEDGSGIILDKDALVTPIIEKHENESQ